MHKVEDKTEMRSKYSDTQLLVKCGLSLGFVLLEGLLFLRLALSHQTNKQTKTDPPKTTTHKAGHNNNIDERKEKQQQPETTKTRLNAQLRANKE